MKVNGGRESGRISPAALAALAFLIVGLAIWASSWHSLPPWPMAPGGSGAPAAGEASGGNGARGARGSGTPSVRGAASGDTAADDAAIARALAMTNADSIAKHDRWHDEVADIAISKLDDAGRDLFIRFANAERCTCGCGYTLAGCRASDMTCEVSGPRLAALFDSVRAGRIRSARGVRSRPASGG